MPIKRYAFTKGGKKRLDLTWKRFGRTMNVWLDDELLGTIPNRANLDMGFTFTLPDGSTLTIRRDSKLGMRELCVLRNHEPLPGSDSDPETRLARAYHAIFIVAGLTILAGGILAWTAFNSRFHVVPPQMLFPIGIGVVYGMMGVGVVGRSKLALGIAVGMYALDAVLVLWELLTGMSTLGASAVFWIVRFYFLFRMLPGFVAIDDLDEIEAAVSRHFPRARQVSSIAADLPPLDTSLVSNPLPESRDMGLDFQTKLTLVAFTFLGGLLVTFLLSTRPQPSSEQATSTEVAMVYLETRTVAVMTETAEQATGVARYVSLLSATPRPTPVPPTPTATGTSVFDVPSRVIDTPPILFDRLDLIDAAYSASTDKILLLSDDLHIFDMVNKTEKQLDLPRDPQRVIVNPTGVLAAVLHYSYPGDHYQFTLIDLKQDQIVKVLSEDSLQLCQFGGIVFAANNHLILSTRCDTVSIDIETNQAEKLSFAPQEGTMILSEDGHQIYALDVVSRIGIYDLSLQPIAVSENAADSECRDGYVRLFAARNGLFTGCGTFYQFSASSHNIEAQGALLNFDPQITYIHALISSQAKHELFLLPFNYPGQPSNEIMVYDQDTFTLKSKLVFFPHFANASYQISGIGYFFANPTIQQFYAVLQISTSKNQDSIGLVVGDL